MKFPYPSINVYKAWVFLHTIANVHENKTIH
jgi:hypothetical protein